MFLVELDKTMYDLGFVCIHFSSKYFCHRYKCILYVSGTGDKNDVKYSYTYNKIF